MGRVCLLALPPGIKGKNHDQFSSKRISSLGPFSRGNNYLQMTGAEQNLFTSHCALAFESRSFCNVKFACI